MKTSKKVGVWMDYSAAHIIEFSENPNEIGTIKSKFASRICKEKNKGVAHLYSLAKQCKTEYLNKIAATISNYDKVLLFGPTNAKAELFNLLFEDQRFFKIKAYLEETGNMSPKKRNRYMSKHFARTLHEAI